MPSYGNGRQGRNLMQKLNILHVDPERNWGGGEVQVLGLTTYLNHSGHWSVVAADPRGTLSQRLTQAELPTTVLKIKNDLDVLAGLRLRRFVQAEKVQIVHFHTARAHALSPWLSGLPVKRVVTRRMDYRVRPGLFTHLLYEKSVDAVIAISHGVQAALVAGGISPSHITIIPSGIDTTSFAITEAQRIQQRAAQGIASDEVVILAVGALAERKGHTTLLQAAAQLQQNGSQIRYLLCGVGPLRVTLEQEAQALGLTETVRFLGFCSDIVKYLAIADVFVHVPLWEGLGVAVIEALAAGLPVVASRVGGIPELVEDGSSGLLISPQEPFALATAIQRLIDNRSWAKALGMQGQRSVRARYDVTVMAQANEALYYKLLMIGA
jgi:glycosyltransferase involved in cell wall biosynthesis